MVDDVKDITEKAESKEALDRARLARERREAEQRKRLDELRAHAAAAQAQREKRDEDRRRRQAEQRAKDDDRRLQVEERKRAIWEASISRREALLQRERDRTERLERARAARSAPRPAFAFGSSTPRLLEPVDSAGFFWAARSTNPIDQMNFFESLAASTTNVMFASAPLTRRASALQLDTSDTDNKDEPDRSPQPIWSSVARRRTDLVPTLPARPGRAYSMTRLDKIPPQRPIHSASPSMHHLNRSQTRSGDTTPGSRPGSAMSSTAVVRRASSAPRKPRPASIAGTGVNTPRGGDAGADTGASSAATTPSVSRDASAVHVRAASTPRRPRPLSLHARHAGPLGPGEGKPPLHRKPKPSKDHDKSSGKSLSASPGRTLSPSPAKERARDAADENVITQPVSDKCQVSALEVTQKLEALQIGDRQQSSEIKENIMNRPETNNEQKVQHNKAEEKHIDVQKPEREREDKKEEKREKEPSQEKTDDNEMTASMTARRITTEEEAKAALAERRRRAREELERQAELERQRLQREAEEEAERQRLEEERQKREEEEARELAALQRKMEEEKLRKAIEMQQQLEREESERRAREEEERRARAREEGERRRAADEAERARREEAERDERERLLRKQRVEAIMARTRLKKQAEEDKKQQEMKTQQNQPATESTPANNIPTSNTTQNNVAPVNNTQDNAAPVTNAAQNSPEPVTNAAQEIAAPIVNTVQDNVNAAEDSSKNVSQDTSAVTNSVQESSVVTNDSAAVTNASDSAAVTNVTSGENAAVETMSVDTSNGNVQTGDLLQLAGSQPEATQEATQAAPDTAPASNSSNGNVTADLLGLSQPHETKDKPDEQPPKQIDNTPTLDANNGNVGRISANFIQSERRDDFAAHNGHGHAHPLTLQNAI
ncbi:MAP7 domain-containing protein 2-like [Vanessa cardui]|uniref:MAP7 domain-containing protein 2-like n=1 Tax=Vanessa cardui TaxID=171605 RepID=UPI001F12900D|nr:MAP7 domain-containing protein 2-like [Vanessa cardui]